MEVALGIYIRPFSPIELAWAVRQPSPCVRALCESCVPFHMSHLKLHFALRTSHCTLHTPHRPSQPTANRRYLSSPAAATLHGKIQGFVLRLPPQNKAHATFMQPLQCVLQHLVANLHLSTHMATPDDNNHAGQFFCHVLLCSVKSHTALHQGKSFCDVLLCDVKSHTALHQGQFFCDVLLCDVKPHTALHQGQVFCDVLLCDVKSHTALHQGQLFCDVLLCDVKSHTTLHQGQLFCDVLLCDVKSHTTHHQGQFHQLKVIRNSEVLLPNFL